MATQKKSSISKSPPRKKSPAKKTTAKKTTVRKSAGTKKVATKSGTGKTTSRKSGAKSASLSLDEARRRQMIAETAYFLAEQRGFKGGSALDDWLIAEAQVDRQFTSQRN